MLRGAYDASGIARARGHGSKPETVVTTKLRPLDNVTAVRNLAVDAYRGLVMLLMMGEVMQFTKVYGILP